MKWYDGLKIEERAEWVKLATIVVLSLWILLEAIAKVDAAETKTGCVTVESLRAHKDATWSVQLTARQFVFLEGVFVMNPMTHPGFPDGDKVFIIKRGDTGMFVWTDESEKLSCDTMPWAAKLEELVDQVGKSGGDDL